jgi:hypothetical protein
LWRENRKIKNSGLAQIQLPDVFFHVTGMAVAILTFGWVWGKILFIPFVTCCGSMDMANVL